MQGLNHCRQPFIRDRESAGSLRIVVWMLGLNHCRQPFIRDRESAGTASLRSVVVRSAPLGNVATDRAPAGARSLYLRRSSPDWSTTRP